ncbi:MAG: cytochrome c [Anaerolineales bacterium]|nr:cytochrome c [Anaerolineales bacterium]
MKRFSPLLIVVVVILGILFLRPRWYLNLTKNVEVSPASGATLVDKYNCRQCHQIEGRGALKAPSLDGVVARLDGATLRLWLESPRKVKANTAMPNFYLSDSEIDAIIEYLITLKEE